MSNEERIIKISEIINKTDLSLKQIVSKTVDRLHIFILKLKEKRSEVDSVETLFLMNQSSD